MSEERNRPCVSLGCWVKVAEEGSGEEEAFQIVSSDEVDLLENKIPPNNPMARALLGSRPGDEVEFEAPKGRITFRILEVGRE